MTRENNSKKDLLTYSLILLAGFVLIFFSINEYKDTSHLASSGIKTKAKVADVIVTRDKDKDKDRDANARYYTPLFEFSDQSGAIHKVKGDETSSPKYANGDMVDIIYDPSRPNQAIAADFRGIYGKTLLFGIFGLICIGTIVWFFIKRKKTK